jgi:hypothetical protein
MSTYRTDARIDHYIATLPDWQQEICCRVRELVHAADSEVAKTIKRTDRPYFTLNGNTCVLLVARDHINVLIADPIVPDPEGLINQGQGNLTVRAIQIRRARPSTSGLCWTSSRLSSPTTAPVAGAGCRAAGRPRSV